MNQSDLTTSAKRRLSAARRARRLLELSDALLFAAIASAVSVVFYLACCFVIRST